MLLDHFHPPLSDQRDWHGFHNAWATYISADLNSALPPQWFAHPHVEFGIEIDVIADIVEVRVFRSSGGNTLVGAIELVSPANKDRPESRDAFVATC
jgi:hypothetical protein